MIKTYRNKSLKELHETGTTAGINAKYHARLREILGVINAAKIWKDMDRPGYRLHILKQFKNRPLSIRALGAWRVTFEWVNGDAYNVDFEQYHDNM